MPKIHWDSCTSHKMLWLSALSVIPDRTWLSKCYAPTLWKAELQISAPKWSKQILTFILQIALYSEACWKHAWAFSPRSLRGKVLFLFYVTALHWSLHHSLPTMRNKDSEQLWRECTVTITRLFKVLNSEVFCVSFIMKKYWDKRFLPYKNCSQKALTLAMFTFQLQLWKLASTCLLPL